MKKTSLLTILLIVVAASTLQARRVRNWMARLPDSALVCMLSIPGTHDSATGNGFEDEFVVVGDRFARTQDLDLKRQWAAGIRAFDLRPCSRGDYLHINHSVVATTTRLDETLLMLRNELRANPSEFAIVILNHETDADIDNNYNELVVQLLQNNELAGCLANFGAAMTVKEARGKILVISRDRYADVPVAGAFFRGWTGSDDWERQTSCRIWSEPSRQTPCYVQDYWATVAPGAQQTKIELIRRLLDASTRHTSTSEENAVWFFNMASAYAKADTLFGQPFALSDGYRENASRTNPAVVQYLRTHQPGPTGIVMADFAGVDKSNGYKVGGKELVRVLIQNNFRYLPKE